MAEFTEVMRQAKRMHDMCNRGGYSCADCPLDCPDGRCMLDFDDKFKPEEVECYIMDWAMEHPEPVYPSWYEYQQQTFPGHSRWICPMAFGVPCQCKSVTSVQACTKCRNNPIPAEIAEKLGIKPKEGRL